MLYTKNISLFGILKEKMCIRIACVYQNITKFWWILS